MPADPARIAVARDLLTQLGVTVDDLRADPAHRLSVPTLGEYLPAVIAAAGPGANRTYGSYWARMADLWGARPLDEISASDIEALRHRSAATARSRRNSRHGRHAGEHVIAAARALYNRAIADGHIAPGASPAHRDGVGSTRSRRRPAGSRHSGRPAREPREVGRIPPSDFGPGPGSQLARALRRHHPSRADESGSTT